MNRSFGTSAGLLALAVFFLHVAMPPGQEERNGQTPLPNAGARNANAASKPTQPTEGPWLATRHFFGTEGDFAIPQRFGRNIDLYSTQDIVNCSFDVTCAAMLGSAFGVRESDDVQFLLATVPDPLHTRLALFTDSSLDAIEKAATEDHWVFATQWLPWTDTIDLDEKDPSKRSEERDFIRKRENQPGVLVFRRQDIEKPQVLIVFIAGETPTAGVNPAQFQIGRAYMRAIREPDELIRIQGPTFSGSLYSMQRLIDADRRCTTARYMIRGMASDPTAGLDLSSHVDFKTTSSFGSSGGTRLAGFPRVLESLGIDSKDAAVLIEDETGYGDSAAIGLPPGLTIFRFPRDISHLRNAYRDMAQTPKQNGAPQPALDFSLKDSETGEDSIPTFGGAQSPLSQSSVLNEITGAIQRDRFRIVEIAATNVLDRLFLAEVLKRQCPDTRLVIDYPDLLFIEAAQSEALTGILTLSNYPLFVHANDWTSRPNQPLTFGGDNGIAVYNATMLLLTVDDSDRPGDEFAYYTWRDDLRSWGDPPTKRGGKPINSARNEDMHANWIDHPPVWLMEVNRQGFEPVELLNPEQHLFEKAHDPKSQRPELPHPPPLWLFLSTTVALASGLAAWWIWHLDKDPRPKIAAAFDPQAIHSTSDRWRLIYLFCIGVLILAIQLILILPFWLAGQHHWFWLIPAAGILASFVSAGYAVRALCRTSGVERVRLAAIFISILFVLSLTELWVRCGLRQPGETGFFFLFRAAEMGIGTCPAWPILAALGVLLAFCLAHLIRLYLAASEAPEIMTDHFETALQQEIKEFCDEFNRCSEAPLGIWTGDQWRGAAYILAPVALAFVAAQTWIQFSSIEGRAYDIVSVTLVMLGIGTLALSAWQVMTQWHRLQGLLSCLDTLPLSRGFIRADHSGGPRPIWVRKLNLQSVDVHAQALIVLHDMTLQCPKWSLGGVLLTYYIALIRELTTVPGPERFRVLLTQRAIRRVSTLLAQDAFGIASQQWRDKPLVEKPQESKGGEPNDLKQAPVEIENPRNICRLAETFVALHYTSFLMYGVRQIRNLLLFLPVGFLLLVFALNSDSHQSPQFIGRLLILMAVPLGAVVWTCLSGMERDPILSRIAGTTPGELSVSTYFKFLGYGALPALGLLASQFPAIANFLYSWVAPTLQAAH